MGFRLENKVVFLLLVVCKVDLTFQMQNTQMVHNFYQSPLHHQHNTRSIRIQSRLWKTLNKLIQQNRLFIRKQFILKTVNFTIDIWIDLKQLNVFDKLMTRLKNIFFWNVVYWWCKTWINRKKWKQHCNYKVSDRTWPWFEKKFMEFEVRWNCQFVSFVNINYCYCSSSC